MWPFYGAKSFDNTRMLRWGFKVIQLKCFFLEKKKRKKGKKKNELKFWKQMRFWPFEMKIKWLINIFTEFETEDANSWNSLLQPRGFKFFFYLVNIFSKWIFFWAKRKCFKIQIRKQKSAFSLFISQVWLTWHSEHITLPDGTTLQ